MLYSIDRSAVAFTIDRGCDTPQVTVFVYSTAWQPCWRIDKVPRAVLMALLQNQLYAKLDKKLDSQGLENNASRGLQIYFWPHVIFDLLTPRVDLAP